MMNIKNLTINTNNEKIAIYSNKKNGFYFTQSVNINSDLYRGWYVFNDKILEDYCIAAGDILFDKSDISAEIKPNTIIKKYKDELSVTESFIDNKDGLILEFESSSGFSFIPLFPDNKNYRLNEIETENIIYLDFNGEFFVIKYSNKGKIEETCRKLINISVNSCKNIFEIKFENSQKKNNNPCIVMSYGLDKNKTIYDCIEIFNNRKKYIQDKEKRITELINRVSVKTNNNKLDKALNWIFINMDNLIMNKADRLNSALSCHDKSFSRGNEQSDCELDSLSGEYTRHYVCKGIFAGYPWFNNYWGRDTFIAFPGAVLVSGRFDEAKEIIDSFFKFQCMDKTNKYYGRIPNLINNQNDFIYNTTDAACWAVIQLYNYLKYTNDIDYIKEKFVNIISAVKGNLKRCDKYNFLIHKDAETWMDARIDGKTPITPRGNRANDIQVLWYYQLKYGSELAMLLNKKELAEEWNEFAEILKKNFVKYFVKQDNTLYDHLNSDGTQDKQIRPNQIFAVSLSEKFVFLDKKIELAILDQVFQKLTYPYGVSSLSEDDPDFHPYHNSPMYHKDMAYHNGTVWQWLAGPLITGLIKHNKKNDAYELTENMVEQSLDMGVAGALAENIDALPQENGEIRLSGAFSQAWSNAEFLRVLFQDYFGFKPDLINKRLILCPNIPDKLNKIYFKGYLGKSVLKIKYEVCDRDNFKCRIIPEKINDKFEIIFKYDNKLSLDIKDIKDIKDGKDIEYLIKIKNISGNPIYKVTTKEI